jgi:hypothetical protein
MCVVVHASKRIVVRRRHWQRCQIEQFGVWRPMMRQNERMERDCAMCFGTQETIALQQQQQH